MFAKKPIVPTPQPRQTETSTGQSALFEKPPERITPDSQPPAAASVATSAAAASASAAASAASPHTAPPRPIPGARMVPPEEPSQPATATATAPPSFAEKDTMTQYPTKQTTPTNPLPNFRSDFRNDARSNDGRGEPARRVDLSGTPGPRASEQEPTRKLIVGRDISLNGEISTCDYLVVEGTVEARVREGRRIEIAETGLFKGTVEIDEADIAGHFEGDIVVRGRLRVRTTGSIKGKVSYGELEIEAGGRIDGQIGSLKPGKADAKPQVQSRSPAVTQTKAAETGQPAALTTESV